MLSLEVHTIEESSDNEPSHHLGNFEVIIDNASSVLVNDIVANIAMVSPNAREVESSLSLSVQNMSFKSWSPVFSIAYLILIFLINHLGVNMYFDLYLCIYFVNQSLSF